MWLKEWLYVKHEIEKVWITKKERDPGKDRGKSKEEKEVKTECSHFLDEPRIRKTCKLRLYNMMRLNIRLGRYSK
jgi:hypothetical protein